MDSGCRVHFEYRGCAAASWSAETANQWYEKQPWLVGSNYIPATAINELEMWQADTFDPKRIDKELGWAEGLGMNTMRVFLHDLLWQQDAAGFREAHRYIPQHRAKHKIKPMFVLFDSCWDPFPKRASSAHPKPGVHNPAGCRVPAPRRWRTGTVSAPRELSQGRGRRVRAG